MKTLSSMINMSVGDLKQEKDVIIEDINKIKSDILHLQNMKLTSVSKSAEDIDMMMVACAHSLKSKETYLKTLNKILDQKMESNYFEVLTGKTSHPFYCKRATNPDVETHFEFFSLDDFESGYADIVRKTDVLFRFDIEESDVDAVDDQLSFSEDYPLDKKEFLIKLFFVNQRDGYMYSVYIFRIGYHDLKQIEDLITDKYKYLKELWSEFK